MSGKKPKSFMGVTMKMTGVRWALLGVAVVGIGMSALMMQYLGKRTGLTPSASITDPARAVRDPIQGGALTPLQESQIRGADAAKADLVLKEGGSFISTPVLQSDALPPLVIDEPEEPVPPVSAARPSNDVGSFDRPRSDPPASREGYVSGQALADSIARVGEVMNARADAASVTYVFARPLATPAAAASANAAQASPVTPNEEGSASPSLVNPGELIYGVFNIRMQSDLPGPVLGELVQGRLRGYKVLGAFERIENRNLMALRLTKLVSPDGMVTQIDGYALHPDTTLPAMATDVDRHMLARAGGLLGAAFLAGVQGYGQAIKQSGTVGVDTGNGTVTTVTNDFTSDDLARIAAGRAAGALEPLMDHLTRTLMQPNTITVAAGTPFVLLVVGP